MVKLPYGIASFESLRKDGYLYVDRTEFIEKIEAMNEKYLLFVRPRRFGKSLFLDTMANYYDIAMKDQFDTLFDGLYIRNNPTPRKSSYLVLKLDFSGIDVSRGIELIQSNFFESLKTRMQDFFDKYKTILDVGSEIKKDIAETQFIEPLLGKFFLSFRNTGLKLY